MNMKLADFFQDKMITSVSNKQIKNIKALCDRRRARREQGLFVVENIRMFREIPRDMLMEVYVSESFLKLEENKKLLKDIKYEVLIDEVFKKTADTQSPQGVIALVRQPEYKLSDCLNVESGDKIIVLNRLQDPGNLGTIMRTAEAAGVKLVIMDNECVDIFSPKVVRSTMGAIFRVPFVYTENLSDTICILKKSGIRCYAAHLEGKKDFRDIDKTVAKAYFIGNEGNGLDFEITNLADEKVFIPMQGKAESLNAAVAAALLMYV